ncbi:hypothetical protein OIN60_07230 [Paenibacillus sp. P96]|uniref:Uncharacterized protein n=1 Tax=Paenibacillus zeirhizosphaerae TaxID=2987519 RepID=A0ABT9FPA5_9BACL|nr:hypothetical protein [Paenibacillus sp. P96]MDP4096558.1 hypothetical protein [Paenibacillus sp. P96]
MSQGVSLTDSAGLASITSHAMTYGINYAFMIATGMSIAALILSFFIQNTNPQKQREGVEKKRRAAVSS